MPESWMNRQVKIVQNLDENREVSGTMGLLEPPKLGDTGKVIYEYPAPDLRVTVEKSDAAGGTVWFADFNRNELELIGEGEGE
jgi:hypothetical protein